MFNILQAILHPIKTFHEWKRKRREQIVRQCYCNMIVRMNRIQIRAIQLSPIIQGTDRKIELQKRSLAIADIVITQSLALMDLMTKPFDELNQLRTSESSLSVNNEPQIHGINANYDYVLPLPTKEESICVMNNIIEKMCSQMKDYTDKHNKGSVSLCKHA